MTPVGTNTYKVDVYRISNACSIKPQETVPNQILSTRFLARLRCWTPPVQPWDKEKSLRYMTKTDVGMGHKETVCVSTHYVEQEVHGEERLTEPGAEGLRLSTMGLWVAWFHSRE